MINPETWYRLEEAAVRGGVAYTSLYSAVRHGAIAAEKRDGVWMVKGDELVRWTQTHLGGRAARWRDVALEVAGVSAPAVAVMEAIAAGEIASRTYAGVVQVNMESLSDWRRRHASAPALLQTPRGRLVAQIAGIAAGLTVTQLAELIAYIDSIKL